MQTLQFTKSLHEIVRELKVPELIQFLQPLLAQGSNTPITEPMKNQFSELLFGAHTGFIRLTEDPASNTVLKSLKVDEIFQAARMGKLLSTLTVGTQAQNIWGNPSNFAEFFSFSQLLRSLADLDATCFEVLEKEKLGGVNKTENILELQVIDYDGKGLEPDRLAKFITTISNLHKDFARILEINDDRFAFIYFDSGSDLVTGIKCASDIVDKVKTLFAEFWDKIIYRRYDEFGKKTEAISKGLSVMGNIQEAVAKRTITEEEGNLLGARVLREIEALTDVGATLPLGQASVRVDRRQLLIERRDMKLLKPAEPAPSDEKPPEPH
jgi:hypothetical protein